MKQRHHRRGGKSLAAKPRKPYHRPVDPSVSVAQGVVGRLHTSEFLALVTTSVLQRVAAGNHAAVRECMDRFGGLVWSLARRLTPTGVEAEDAAQEIFIALWKSADRFDPAVASETTFVAMIARRRLIDRARARGRQVTPEAITDSTTAVQPTPAIEVGEEAAIAAEAIESLSPEQQRVLRLSVYQGLSHEQIAQSTGLPLGTVKTHIRRGLMRVRELLETERGAVE